MPHFVLKYEDTLTGNIGAVRFEGIHSPVPRQLPSRTEIFKKLFPPISFITKAEQMLCRQQNSHFFSSHKLIQNNVT